MILSSALRTGGARADAWTSALDDRWYSSDLAGEVAFGSGISIDAESIFRCGTVLAAIRFKAEAVAVCTPHAFRRLPSGKREKAPLHPVQAVLRNPNAWQTGFEWAHLNVVWISTWGNSYNRIVPGPRYFAEQLRPLHPARTCVLSQNPDGSLVYEHRPLNGPREVLTSDQVLHYRGLSLDGFEGVAMYQLIRNVVSIALLAEKHTGSFLAKGSRLAGLLVPSAPTGAEKRKELKDSWNESFGGPDKTGTVGVLPFGVAWQAIASDNQKGQVLELTNQQVESLLRFLGVPGVVVGYQGDKASTYASADAFFEKGGIKHCIQPLVMTMEQRDQKALLVEGDPHYVKRNLDVLQRANTQDRIAMLVQATGGPIYTRNEAREIEDMNAIDDPEMDKVLEPGNMAPTGEEPEPTPVPFRRRSPAPPADDDEEDAADADASARHRLFAADAAARVVRREIAAIKGGTGTRGAAVRYAKDPAGWKVWAMEFYGKHAGYVVEAMHVTEDQARAYADSHRDELLSGGLAVVETWETESIPLLARMALGQDREGSPVTAQAAAPAAPAPIVVNVRNVIRRQKPPVVQVSSPPVVVNVPPGPSSPPVTVNVPPEPERKPRAVKVEYGKDGRIAGVREE